jgi:hypothetical protein
LDRIGEELKEFTHEGEIERAVIEGEFPYVTFTELDCGASGEEILFIKAGEQGDRVSDESRIDVDPLDVDAEVGGQLEGEKAEPTADIED